MNQYIQIKNTVVLASKPPWLLTPPTRIATNPFGDLKKKQPRDGASLSFEEAPKKMVVYYILQEKQKEVQSQWSTHLHHAKVFQQTNL